MTGANLGANGLAAPRDFLTPVARFEERTCDYTILHKLGAQLFQARAAPCMLLLLPEPQLLHVCPVTSLSNAMLDIPLSRYMLTGIPGLEAILLQRVLLAGV